MGQLLTLFSPRLSTNKVKPAEIGLSTARANKQAKRLSAEIGPSRVQEIVQMQMHK